MAKAEFNAVVKVSNAQIALLAANTQLSNAPVTAAYITERAGTFKRWLDEQDKDK